MQNIKELNFPPGTAYEYMNPTFQLMYTIIEKCSGRSFDDFMRERLFLPSGMTEATYFEEGKQIPRMAHGYRLDRDGSWREYDYGETSFFATKADGGLYTSVEEFVLWEKALRNNILITARLKEEAHSSKIQIPDIPYTGYGYGWFIEQKPGFPKKVYHTGNNGGFQIFAGTYPEQQILVLIFATRDDIDREDTVEKVDQIIKNAGWLE
jgi:CubicO group peptidase (beta-lactamase class C family)